MNYKKYLLFILLALPFYIWAQPQDEGLKIESNSFHNINEPQIAKDGSVMSMNMFAKQVPWGEDDYKNVDGLDNIALLLVTFDNMSFEEIQRVVATFSNTSGKTLEPRIMDDGSTIVLRVIVPVDKRGKETQRDITFNHPTYGSTRLVGKSFRKHNVYTVNVINAKRVNIRIETNPENAEVYFDKKYIGRTPCDIKDVSMNSHELQLKCVDNSFNSWGPRNIKVDDANTFFSYDLRKTKNVKFTSGTKGAYMQLLDPNNGDKIIAEGLDEIIVNQLPYGGYTIQSRINGRYADPISVTINNTTPDVYALKVQESKAITFIAFQNNKEIVGAQVDLGGKQIGQTPLTFNVPYGKHQVHMSYYGQSKYGTLKVDKNSDNQFQLILPNSYSYRSRWNPFDIDYNKRDWAFDFSYVNKQYVYKEKYGKDSYSSKHNNWGDEDKMQHGMQFGIVYQPYFGYGQGLVTGLYYQLFISSPDIDGGCTETEHDFYIPLLYRFRLPLAEEFSIYVHGGVAMQIGLYHELSFSEYGEDYNYNIGFGHNNEYDLYMPNACQFFAPLGGGFQYKALQVEFTYSWGLNNNSGVYQSFSDVKQSFKARMMQATISLAF